MLFSRFNAFIGILGVLLVATVFVGSSGGLLSNGDAVVTRTAVDLIAYADLDGQIYTITPDGSSLPRRISPDVGFYTWPTWSPDATRVVFSGTTPDSKGAGPLVLYMNELSTGESRVLYTNQAGLGPVLPSMPHYPIWSPDGSHLAYMASVSDGLTLFLDDISDDESGKAVLRDSPLYASWSSDSKRLMVHAGVEHVLVDAMSGRLQADVVSLAAGYRTPAWSPLDGNKVALLQSNSRIRSLNVADVETGEMMFVDGIRDNAAFLWSPDGGSLAVATSRLQHSLVSPAIEMYAPDGSRRAITVEGAIKAFFWSPDSTKLAYVVLTRDRDRVRVMMLDRGSGETWPLFDFIPTPDQSIIFDFFDQFAYSHSPWSPDSKSLVLAGNLSHDGTSVALNVQASPQIYVVDVGRNPSVTRIADGFLAVWSPR